MGFVLAAATRFAPLAGGGEVASDCRVASRPARHRNRPASHASPASQRSLINDRCIHRGADGPSGSRAKPDDLARATRTLRALVGTRRRVTFTTLRFAAFASPRYVYKQSSVAEAAPSVAVGRGGAVPDLDPALDRRIDPVLAGVGREHLVLDVGLADPVALFERRELVVGVE